MIHSVAIENFKNLRRIQIDLDRLTVFVGPNASGKTSVLQAVDLAIRAAIKQEPRIPPPIRSDTGTGISA